MISKLNFKNYKGFKSAELDLKPITILLGANSTGKSSIIQLFLMLSQTINNDKQCKSALRLNGDLVRLGEYENIFHNKNVKHSIELELYLSDFEVAHIFQKVKDKIEDVYFSLRKVNSLLDNKGTMVESKIDIYGKYNYFEWSDYEALGDCLNELPKIRRQINNKLRKIEPEIGEKVVKRYFRNVRNRHSLNISYDKECKKLLLDFKPFKLSYDFLETLEQEIEGSISINYRISYNKKESKIDVDKISIRSCLDKDILTYSYDRVQRGKHHNLSSDFVDDKVLDKYRSKFGNSVLFNGLDIARKKRVGRQIEDVFIDTLYELFKSNIANIDFEFGYNKINYVSPLRAYPKRYYFLDESVVNNSLDSVNGNQLAEVLSENTDIIKKVNNWLGKFNFKVSVSQLKDVIHNIRINQNGLMLDITDVGFGLSQILPIIVQGFLSADNSLTIIEQPEIHLHPRMQAELADLFIDIMKETNDFEEGKSLLIETHSEYLLKRLRRRIAEGKVRAEDVGIYFIHPKDKDYKYARVENIEISKTGAFAWPSDFYIDDINDTMEFLKYQK